VRGGSALVLASPKRSDGCPLLSGCKLLQQLQHHLVLLTIAGLHFLAQAFEILKIFGHFPTPRIHIISKVWNSMLTIRKQCD
jgi:hypothetical protein